MAESFDPYRKWLGIAPQDHPPNHYRLLGISPFESDPDVIENAATRQMTHVRTFQASKHSAISQRILTELSIAKLCLLTPERKEAYDSQLRTRLAAEGKLPPLLPAGAGAPAPPPRAPLPPFPRNTDVRWRLEDSTASEPAELLPVPIPMPDDDATSVPVVRRMSSAYVRARRKKNVVPALIIIVSLAVLIGGGAIAAMMMSGRSIDRASHFQRPSAAPPPTARTE